MGKSKVYGTFRYTNFELMRVICMLLLVAHHYCVHGGILHTESRYKVIALLFYPAGKISFVAFIAVTMYFLVDKDFKSIRFIKIWLETFFYSVVFFLVSLFYATPVSKSDLIRNGIGSLFPIAGNSHGFAASYLLFYAFFPFISSYTKTLSKQRMQILLVILFYAQIVSSVIMTVTGHMQPILSHVQLFLFCYLLMIYIKKWAPRNIATLKVSAMIFIVIYLYIFIIAYFSNISEINIFKYISALTKDESSLLYIIAGFALFFIFKNISVKYNPVINKLAGCTFGVLLIHDHNFFRAPLWHNIIKTQDWFYSVHFVSYYIVSIFGIFFTGCLVDLFRQNLFERFFLNSQFVQRCCERLDCYVNNETIRG